MSNANQQDLFEQSAASKRDIRGQKDDHRDMEEGKRLRLEKVEPLGVDYACIYASDVEKIKATIKMKCDAANIEPVSLLGLTVADHYSGCSRRV